MRKVRSFHLYLGCIFAPMLLFFAVSGFWQTYDPSYDVQSKILALLSTIHKSSRLKSGATLSSPMLRDFVLCMAVCFIIQIVLGIIMALRYAHNRKAAYYCLGAGVIFPLGVILNYSLHPLMQPNPRRSRLPGRLNAEGYYLNCEPLTRRCVPRLQDLDRQAQE